MKRQTININTKTELRDNTQKAIQLQARMLKASSRTEFDKLNNDIDCLDIERENILTSIKDETIKELYRLHYLQKKSWLRIAFLTGAYDESVPRKRFKRYLIHNGIELTKR